MKNNLLLRELFEKYLQGSASDAEKTALMEALGQFTNEELSEVLAPIAANTERDPQFRIQEWEPAIQAILRHKEEVNKEEDDETKEKDIHEPVMPDYEMAEERLATPVRRLYVPGSARRWVAAASILLAIATGVFLFLARSKDGGKAEAVKTNQTIQPGGDKAVLTLSDGSTIVLENAGNGQVAQQGSMTVLKLDKGVLSYRGPDKEGAGSKAGDSNIAQKAGAGKTDYNILTAPRGGRYQVVLPDGSSVVLNSASSLRYPTVFTGTSREVELTGEGYFEISQDKTRPFFVKAGGVQIAVLGTSFNIMAYQEEGTIRTTLVQGAVALSSQGFPVTKLRPGQQGAIDLKNTKGNQTTPGSIPISNPDLQEVLAWKEGKFWFEDAKIDFIMRQIARWYDADIKYEGAVTTEEFNGIFLRKANVSDLLDVLELTGHVHFRIEGKQIVVMPGHR